MPLTNPPFSPDERLYFGGRAVDLIAKDPITGARIPPALHLVELLACLLAYADHKAVSLWACLALAQRQYEREKSLTRKQS